MALPCTSSFTFLLRTSKFGLADNELSSMIAVEDRSNPNHCGSLLHGNVVILSPARGNPWFPREPPPLLLVGADTTWALREPSSPSPALRLLEVRHLFPIEHSPHTNMRRSLLHGHLVILAGAH
jgi:hypothetical protein